MANYCTNTLRVSSDNNEQLITFICNARGKVMLDDKEIHSNLSFGQFLPLPNEYNENSLSSDQLKALFGSPSWDEWFIDNWGTNCEALDVEIEDVGEDFIEYSFYTKWEPPLEFLLNISLRYPELQFEIFYDEDGMDIHGKVLIGNGELVELDIE